MITIGAANADMLCQYQVPIPFSADAAFAANAGKASKNGENYPTHTFASSTSSRGSFSTLWRLHEASAVLEASSEHPSAKHLTSAFCSTAHVAWNGKDSLCELAPSKSLFSASGYVHGVQWYIARQLIVCLRPISVWDRHTLSMRLRRMAPRKTALQGSRRSCQPYTVSAKSNMSCSHSVSTPPSSIICRTAAIALHQATKLQQPPVPLTPKDSCHLDASDLHISQHRRAHFWVGKHIMHA